MNSPYYPTILRTLFLVVFSLYGCVDLEENPKGVMTTDNFFNTESDALAAIASTYNAALNNGGLTMYNRLIHQAVEIISDDATAGPRMTNNDARAMAFLTLATTNDRIDELWKQHYVAINRANIAIRKIPAISMNEQLQNRLVNEAKFLRALLYFNLVRLWGDVPLILEETGSLSPDNIHLARTPANQVYEQILQDLADAESLPNQYGPGDLGRATEGAAKTLAAKVHLTRQDWQKASDKLLEVINGPYGYDLFENFEHVFDVAYKNGKEHIFSAQFKSNVNGQGNRLASSCSPNGIPGMSAAGTDLPNEGVYDLFRDEDKRKPVTFFTSIVSPTNGRTYTFEPRFFKYFDPEQRVNPTESARNVPILRFADVLLMFAEADNELNGPTTASLEAINRVRNRAGLEPIESNAKNEFRELIYLERRLELMMEFHRTFDLKRWGRLTSQLQAWGKPNAAEKHNLYPIPQREIDLNPNLTQNPGWE